MLAGRLGILPRENAIRGLSRSRMPMRPIVACAQLSTDRISSECTPGLVRPQKSAPWKFYNSIVVFLRPDHAACMHVPPTDGNSVSDFVVERLDRKLKEAKVSSGFHVRQSCFWNRRAFDWTYERALKHNKDAVKDWLAGNTSGERLVVDTDFSEYGHTIGEVAWRQAVKVRAVKDGTQAAVICNVKRAEAFSTRTVLTKVTNTATGESRYTRVTHYPTLSEAKLRALARAVRNAEAQVLRQAAEAAYIRS